MYGAMWHFSQTTVHVWLGVLSSLQISLYPRKPWTIVNLKNSKLHQVWTSLVFQKETKKSVFTRLIIMEYLIIFTNP